MGHTTTTNGLKMTRQRRVINGQKVAAHSDLSSPSERFHQSTITVQCVFTYSEEYRDEYSDENNDVYSDEYSDESDENNDGYSDEYR
jgi:hypothetical protein